MKARAIDELDPAMPLEEAARRIIAVRTAELYAFVPAALDERNAVALHDMRIAAKRLRYALDVVAFSLDAVAEEARAVVRELQRVIGAIHDHDILLARIAQLPRAHAKGADRLAERVGGKRSELFGEFTALWHTIERSGLRDRLDAATSPSRNATAIGA